MATTEGGLGAQSASITQMDTPDESVPTKGAGGLEECLLQSSLVRAHSAVNSGEKRTETFGLEAFVFGTYGVLISLLLFAGIFCGSFYLLCGHQLFQHYMRSRDFSPFIEMVGRGSASSVVAINVLHRLALGNPENKQAMVKCGVVPPLVQILNGLDAVSDGEQQVAARMIQFLCLGSKDNAKAVLSSGGISALANVARKAPGTNAGMAATEALAVLLANGDSAYRQSVSDADVVDSLIGLLTTGPVSRMKGVATWTLANLAAVDPTTQQVLGNSKVVESLIKLLWEGTNELVAHNALLALGNLVVNNTKNQEVVRELNGIEAAVNLLEASLDSKRDDLLEVDINTELVEKVLEATKWSSVLRSAIHELGGAEQFIQLAMIEEDEIVFYSNPNKRTLAMHHNRGHQGASRRVMDEMKDLLKALQEEVDQNQDFRTYFILRFISPSVPSHVDVRLLEATSILSRGKLAERAAWAIGNMAARNFRNQQAIRKAGGIELLLKMLRTVNNNPSAAESAAIALSNIAEGNMENILAVRRGNGLEVLTRILGTHSDKRVVASAARMLKIMAHDHWLESGGTFHDIGQWIARQLHETMGIEIPPLGAFTTVICLVGALVTVVIAARL